MEKTNTENQSNYFADVPPESTDELEALRLKKYSEAGKPPLYPRTEADVQAAIKFDQAEAEGKWLPVRLVKS